MLRCEGASSIIWYDGLAQLVPHLSFRWVFRQTRGARSVVLPRVSRNQHTSHPWLLKQPLELMVTLAIANSLVNNHSRSRIVRPRGTRLDQSAYKSRFRTFWSLTSRGLPARLHENFRLWQGPQRLKPIDLWARSACCFTPNSYLDLLTQTCGDEPSSDQHQHTI